MNIHYLQHVPFEGPGYITEWANRAGYALTSTSLYQSDPFPDPDTLDLLFVLGGPMGALDEREYPWLVSEKSFIRECINRNIKIIGICLGAQLLANCLGADVYPMEDREIGWFPIQWSSAARESSFIDLSERQQYVLHWHGDTFDLPDGAIRLAKSSHCSNQAFIMGEHILGLQFHLEMRREDVALLIQQEDLEEGPRIQSPKTILSSSYYHQTHKTFGTLVERFLNIG